MALGNPSVARFDDGCEERCGLIEVATAGAHGCGIGMEAMGAQITEGSVSACWRTAQTSRPDERRHFPETAVAGTVHRAETAQLPQSMRFLYDW